MHLRKFLYILAGFSLMSSICAAVDLSSTEIINVQGRVEVKKGPAAIFTKLNRNLKLAGSLKRLDSGDKVKTFIKSAAEMALKETCILAVKEQSLFEVPQTLGKEAVTQLKAQQGSILFKVISGNNFEVKTADVIAGVKGTLFEMDIVDSFNTLIETPALELGTLTVGGTMVNVYRGEVELTHVETGSKRTLNSGQGISVFGRSLLNLNSIFKDGFGQIVNFEPEQLLRESFGDEAMGLLNAAPDLSSLSNLPSAGSFNYALKEAGARKNAFFRGIDQGIAKKLGIDDLETGLDIIKDLQDEKYKADFSRYRPPTSTFSVDDRSFRENYIGKKTFAACKADFGSKRAKLEPTPEGLSLAEGNSSFKVIRFSGNNTDLEFVSSYYESQGKRVNSVQVLKGELFGRIPGELEYFKIPAGRVSFVFDTGTGQSSWVQANAQSLASDLKDYSFKVSQKIAKEKEAVNKKNTKKKINAIKKVIKFKKFGF